MNLFFFVKIGPIFVMFWILKPSTWTSLCYYLCAIIILCCFIFTDVKSKWNVHLVKNVLNALYLPIQEYLCKSRKTHWMILLGSKRWFRVTTIIVGKYFFTCSINLFSTYGLPTSFPQRWPKPKSPIDPNQCLLVVYLKRE